MTTRAKPLIFVAVLAVLGCTGVRAEASTSPPPVPSESAASAESSVVAPSLSAATGSGSPIIATIPVGATRDAAPIGVGQFGDRIQVELHEENRFELIDPKTNAVDRYLGAAVHGFFVISGQELWTTDRFVDTVSRVDIATGKTSLTVKVPGASALIAAPDGLWISSSFPEGGWNGLLTLIDPRNGTVIRTMRIPMHLLPGGGGPSLVAGSLWVTGDDGSGLALFRLDPKDGRQQARLDYAPETVSFAFGTIWLTSRHGGRILRLDPATNRLLAEIPLGAPNPPVVDGDRLWLTDYDGTIARIDPVTNDVSTPIRLGASALGPPIVAFGSIWVASHDDNVVLRLDRARLLTP
jgi:streptogramin lyase